MMPFTAHVLNHWQDSHDALPAHALTHSCSITFEHSHIPAPPVPGFTTQAHELRRMREKPHLYEEWQIDLAQEAREAELHRLGLSEWDCGTCGRIVTTPTPYDACPKCGAA